MIKSLKVQNFALISDLDMSFEPGLTVLTGETGAGKSIILESLQLLFGKRSDAQMIRYGETKAIVTGIFSLPREVANTFELQSDVTITRGVDQRGKHQVKLNGNIITLAELKALTATFASIHSQDETMMLLDKSSYLQLIDQNDEQKTQALYQTYLLARSNYLDQKRKFLNLQKEKNNSLERIDFLTYQIKEIESYNLVLGEKQALEENIKKLSNYDKIMSQLQMAYELLTNEAFHIDQVYEAAQALQKIKDLDVEYSSIKERLENSYYDIDDIISKLYQQINAMDFNQEEFNQMQERHYELLKIEQKYQKPVEEILAYYEEIKNELLKITNYDEYVIEAKNKLNKYLDDAFQKGMKLSDYRQKLAKNLKIEIVEELKDLDLNKATFDIIFANLEKVEENLFETGIDDVEFMISLNEGEPIKPLARVTSGGERARFMFALKSIYAKKNKLSLLVLDEIDIGISGRTAAMVASKMASLSQIMQLIVITHLPQVAAKANYQYGIYKEKENDRMVTRIKLLTTEERISHIASMLSDGKLSHYAIGQAKMLLGLE